MCPALDYFQCSLHEWDRSNVNVSTAHPIACLQVHHFRKPWFVSLQGAVGCTLCFIPFWLEVLKQRRYVAVAGC